MRRKLKDAQLILFGGMKQDEPLNDLWIYDV